MTLVGLGWFETSGQDIHPTSTRHQRPTSVAFMEIGLRERLPIGDHVRGQQHDVLRALVLPLVGVVGSLDECVSGHVHVLSGWVHRRVMGEHTRLDERDELAGMAMQARPGSGMQSDPAKCDLGRSVDLDIHIRAAFSFAEFFDDDRCC